MSRPFALWLSLLAGACSWIDQSSYDARRDQDGDGVGGDVDCDDDDSTRGPPDTWYRDADGDGAGAPLDTLLACAPPEGFVAAGTDCDDDDPAVGPGATEVCGGRDEDCDGLVDDLDPSLAGDVPQWLPDADDDGFPAAFGAAARVVACLQPAGYLPLPDQAGGFDCDDDAPGTFPGAAERCDGVDNDCDVAIDESTDPDDPAAVAHVLDADADGWPPAPSGASLEVDYACAVPPGRAALDAYLSLSADAAAGGLLELYDCDDANDGIAPDVFDRPYDGVDADCQRDDDDDDDGDGFAAVSAGGTDCDDTKALVNPLALETCATPDDDDCDGDLDTPDLTESALFLLRDADNDGWPVDEVEIPRCALETGWTDAATYADLLDAAGLAPGDVVLDCDDANPNRYPSANDAPYNDRDEDCQGDSDYDADGDGEDSASQLATGTDCNDSDDAIASGLPERCDTPFDDNCDGVTLVPDLITGVEVAALPDADGDGWPESDVPVPLCAITAGWTSVADHQERIAALRLLKPDVAVVVDCDGADPSRHPAQLDTAYDGLDTDCQGDDDFDRDGDGERASGTPGGTDCDDGDPRVNTAAQEDCDTPADDDCDGDAGRPDLLTQGLDVRPDADQDGWPALGSATVRRCAVEPGFTSVEAHDALRLAAGLQPGDVDEDCADDNPNRHPGLSDPWYDGVDTDCQGDDDFDQDGDGQAASFAPGGGQDCDDLDGAVFVGAIETCATLHDDDCDGDATVPDLANDGTPVRADDDDDGWPLAGSPTLRRCGVPEGFASVADIEALRLAAGLSPGDVDEDCDDADPNRHPGRQDAWYDGVDADCQGDDDFDQDGDGQAALSGGGGDCDDLDDTIFVGALERCDTLGVDDDCDGDTEDPGPGGGGVPMRVDGDGDGWPASDAIVSRCTLTAGWVTRAAHDAAVVTVGLDPQADVVLDCDDALPQRNPGLFDAPYDGFDADCQGDSDFDADGDGFDLNDPVAADCDDADDLVFPGAVERCATVGVDDDCDGEADERGALGGLPYFVDDDADGYAASLSVTVEACADDDTLLTGLEVLSLTADCDDLDPEVHPDADDAPDDGLDQDCNGVDAVTCYADDDLDGEAGVTTQVDPEGDCAAQGLFGVPGADCDDADPTVRPGRPELCDEVDNNCDGAFGPALTGFPHDPQAAPVEFASGDEIRLADFARVAVCDGVWDVQLTAEDAVDGVPLVLEGVSGASAGASEISFERPVLMVSGPELLSSRSDQVSLALRSLDLELAGGVADLTGLAALDLIDVTLRGDAATLAVGAADGVTLESFTLENSGAPLDDGLTLHADAELVDVQLVGAGLAVASGVVDAEGLIVSNASRGLWVDVAGQLTARDVALVDNGVAGEVHGALFLTDAIVGGNDGPVLVADAATFSASGVAFESNRGTLGGAVRGEIGSIVILSRSTFVGNQADYGGGALLQGLSAVVGSAFDGNLADYGGAAFVQGNATFSGVTVKGNAAVRGGGLHVGGLSVPLAFPDAPFTTVQVANPRFDLNTATDGGCLSAHDATLVVTKGDLLNCEAGNRGGALYASGGASVAVTTRVEGGLARLGGGAFVTDLSVIETCGGLWTGNTADVGGALALDADTVAHLGNTHFDANVAKDLGPLAFIEADAELSVGTASACLGLTPTATGHLDPTVFLSERGTLSGVGWQLPAGNQTYYDEAARKAFSLP